MAKNRRKKKKQNILIISLMCVLLVEIAVLVLLWTGVNHKLTTNEPTVATSKTTESVETQETVTIPEEVIIEKPVIRDYDVVELVDGQIETPYCTLNYPEELAEFLLIINTSKEPYIVEFYAVMDGKQELRLFDISLGESSGGNMGMAVTSEGEVPLNVTIYDLNTDHTWSKNEITTAYAMQEVVNDIIVQLTTTTDEVQTDAPIISQQPDDEDSTINNLEVETPFCTVYYPARWAGTVSCINDDTQEDVYKVHFYSRIDGLDDQLLFSIYFGGDEGQQLGVVMSGEEIPVPVYLVMGMLQLDGLSEDEITLICAMQEAVNQVIERLPLLQ